MNKEKHQAICRARYDRLKREHRCTTCAVQLPPDSKRSTCFKCRLRNAEACRKYRERKRKSE